MKNNKITGLLMGLAIIVDSYSDGFLYEEIKFYRL